jgi:hypothetical protein
MPLVNKSKIVAAASVKKVRKVGNFSLCEFEVEGVEILNFLDKKCLVIIFCS